MRVILQRVNHASVTIKSNTKCGIDKGILVFFAVEQEYEIKDLDWLINKILNMRIFSDKEDKMNLSVKDVDGEILVISQFTLYASTKKGNRPSFTKSENPINAEEVYQLFLDKITQLYPGKVKSGEFGADMKVTLTNDGPVTIIVDSRIRE